MVFLFPLTAHTAKCFLVLSYPITPATKSFLDISSIFLHLIIQTGSLNKISRAFTLIFPARYQPQLPNGAGKVKLQWIIQHNRYRLRRFYNLSS